jgi:dipeptidyl aminopeptidase/acylaminoacyl peptidase
MMRVKGIGAVQVSPDGRRVVYSVTEAVMQGDRSENVGRIFLSGIDGTQLRAVTSGERTAEDPQWSPDGRWIAYLSDRGGKRALWLAPSDSEAPAQPLSDLKSAVTSFRWSPDGRMVAFTSREPATADEERGMREKDDARVVDEQIKMDRLHVLTLRPAEAGQAPIASEPRVITGRTRSVGSRGLRTGRPSYDWSPDSKHLVFTHTRTPLEDDWASADLSVVEVATGTERPLAQTGAAEVSPFFSPDGRWIAYLASDDPPTWGGAGRIQVISAQEPGARPRALADTFDGFSRYSNLVGWSADGKQVYFTELRGTVLSLNAMPLEGKPMELGRLPGTGAAVHLNSSRHTVGFSLDTRERAPEVYAGELAAFRPARVSDVNSDSVGLPLGRTEVIRWKARDGLEIEGLLTYPATGREGRHPLLVIAHGGPMGAFTQGFAGVPGSYPVAAFSARGYAILRPNVRGSSGYGRKFRYANMGDWGGKDFQDLMAGVDHVIAMGVADPDRLGMMGWSYGGYMTSWAITQTRRFKAASVGAGVTNLVSFTGTSDIPGFLPDYFGGELWNRPEAFRAHSPIFQVKGVTTPTLIQHGERDERVPLSQGTEFYTALKRQGCPVKMVIYPRTPHGLSEPRLVLDSMRRNLEWFDAHLGHPTTEARRP